MKYSINAANSADRESILALLPRLADFDVPKHRAPQELWQGDADMVNEWAAGQRPELDLWVARARSSMPVSSKYASESASMNTPTRAYGNSTVSSPAASPAASPATSPATSPASANSATSPASARPVTSNTERKRPVIGVCIVSYKPDPLSSKPIAHLEVIVVDKEFEGKGVAGALLDQAQKTASIKRAEAMSLHVFASNLRARDFYEHQGFRSELIRYSKPLKVRRVHNFFGKHVATSGVARSIKKLLRTP